MVARLVISNVDSLIRTSAFTAAHLVRRKVERLVLLFGFVGFQVVHGAGEPA